MHILIIDTGMCNIGSVKRAFEECGATVQISKIPINLDHVSAIVLPGVGVYLEAMQQLRKSGWIDVIRYEVLVKGMPILGICLGMQLLADYGEEGGGSEGLGLIPGRVKSLSGKTGNFSIPHIGWNEIHYKKNSIMTKDIPSGSDFYFVHSYHLELEDCNFIVSTTPYDIDFVSMIRKNTIWGTQFHPEKSGHHGFQIIRNFLSVLTC